jgi:hypothetical protein
VPELQVLAARNSSIMMVEVLNARCQPVAKWWLEISEFPKGNDHYTAYPHNKAPSQTTTEPLDHWDILGPLVDSYGIREAELFNVAHRRASCGLQSTKAAASKQI